MSDNKCNSKINTDLQRMEDKINNLMADFITKYGACDIKIKANSFVSLPVIGGERCYVTEIKTKFSS